MKSLLLLPILVLLLSGCAKPEVIDSDIEICISDECRLEELTKYCSYHDGIREFSNIDADHYYAVCNDNTYVIVAYEKIDTFVLDLNEFK